MQHFGKFSYPTKGILFNYNEYGKKKIGKGLISEINQDFNGNYTFWIKKNGETNGSVGIPAEDVINLEKILARKILVNKNQV